MTPDDLPSRAYLPMEDVCTKLANIYRIALRISRRGLTIPVLLLFPMLGGLLLPKTFGVALTSPRQGSTHKHCLPTPPITLQDGPRGSAFQPNLGTCHCCSGVLSPGTPILLGERQQNPSRYYADKHQSPTNTD